MKKLMYLLVAGILTVFAACGGACSEDCAKECCGADTEVVENQGCKTGGECLPDHSCCIAPVEEEAVAEDSTVAEEEVITEEAATEEVEHSHEDGSHSH